MKIFNNFALFGIAILVFIVFASTVSDTYSTKNLKSEKEEYLLLNDVIINCPLLRYYVDDNIQNTKYFATENVPEPSLDEYKEIIREAAEVWNQVNAAVILIETECEDDADLVIKTDAELWGSGITAPCAGASGCYFSQEKVILLLEENHCNHLINGQVISPGVLITDFPANGLTGGNDCLDDCEPSPNGSIGNQAILACIGPSLSICYDDINVGALSCNDCRHVDLKSLIIHEFGHALGLDHTDLSNSGAVMRGSEDIFLDGINPGEPSIKCWNQQYLAQDDKNGLIAKHGQFKIEGPAPICGASHLSLGDKWDFCDEDLLTNFIWEAPEFLNIFAGQGTDHIFLEVVGPVPETFSVSVSLEILSPECGEILATKFIASKTFKNQIEYNEDIIANGETIHAQKITVKSGASVRIKNSVISLPAEGQIFLEKGSRLILQNTKIKGCAGEQWKGIFMSNGDIPQTTWGDLEEGNAPILIIQEGSEIRDSEFGATNMFNELCTGFNLVCGDANGVISATDSYFYDNIHGIYFANQHESRSEILGCRFEDNEIGLRSWNTSEIKVQGTTFINNEEGILSLDSYIRILGSNLFEENTTAVAVMGSFPLASGAQIGEEGTYNKNTFTNNFRDINGSGNTHYNQLIVQNNLFENENLDEIPGNVSPGILLSGWNNYEFFQNSLVDYEFPLISHASGSFDNSIQCNEMRSYLYDIWFIENNSSSEFLENNFYLEGQTVYSSLANVALNNATIKSSIGSQASPSGNSFESCAGVLGVEFLTENSEPFIYNYNDLIPCQEPLTPAEYIKVPSQNESNYCDGNIGVFDLIDPDSDGIVGLTPGFNLATVCKSCIVSNLVGLINALNGLGISQPNISIGEDDLMSYYDLQLEIEEWVRFSLLVSEETNDINFATTVLSMLVGDWKWQQTLYGFYLKNTMWSHAENVLTSIVTNNEEKANFVAIQNINLDYLQALADIKSYTITQSDLDNLFSIGQTENSSSGYARGLYKIFTGEDIPFSLPEIVSPRSQDKKLVKKNTTIYPNPTKTGNIWTVKSDQTINSIALSDLSGKEFYGINIDKSTAQIETKELAPGIYIMKIELENQSIEFHRLIVAQE